MECTVPVQVQLATEHADIGSLERTVSAALADVGVALWRALVTQLEVSLPAPAACEGCGGAMKANGRAPRRLVTLTGEVELRRRRYRCTGCGIETVPLDAALGLEPRVQHTLGVRERGLSYRGDPATTTRENPTLGLVDERWRRPGGGARGCWGLACIRCLRMGTGGVRDS